MGTAISGLLIALPKGLFYLSLIFIYESVIQLEIVFTFLCDAAEDLVNTFTVCMLKNETKCMSVNPRVYRKLGVSDWLSGSFF